MWEPWAEAANRVQAGSIPKSAAGSEFGSEFSGLLPMRSCRNGNSRRAFRALRQTARISRQSVQGIFVTRTENFSAPAGNSSVGAGNPHPDQSIRVRLLAATLLEIVHISYGMI